MNKNELNEFSKLWIGIYETYGKTLTPTTIAIFLDVLKDYSYEQVRDGLKAHLANPKGGSFVPRPSDVIRFLTQEPNDGRVGADVAWSMLPRSESDSTCWTDEIAGAYGVCLPLIEENDMVAARMAFREEYNRRVKSARQQEVQCKWIVSLGEDQGGRETARIKARELNMSLPSNKTQFKAMVSHIKPLQIEKSDIEKVQAYSQEEKTKTLEECMNYFERLDDKETVIKHQANEERKRLGNQL